ncbi:50S ribosomal protein L6 [Candidatus Woesearchaeota archaeon]|nr:50S ribosomal protein L6 [Candidatus Woesearchaeota archaeon]
MKLKELRKEIVIPDGVEVKVISNKVMTSGPRGENSRNFLYPRLKISKEENKLLLSIKNATKKEKTMMGTFSAHTKNLVYGVKDGFDYRLKICSGHFPMTVKVEDNIVVINNFMGEKVPRKAKILKNVDVKIENDLIIVSGFDIEKVGQSAANIELATKRAGFDKRIFQDGCYIIEKSGRGLT